MPNKGLAWIQPGFDSQHLLRRSEPSELQSFAPLAANDEHAFDDRRSSGPVFWDLKFWVETTEWYCTWCCSPCILKHRLNRIWDGVGILHTKAIPWSFRRVFNLGGRKLKSKLLRNDTMNSAALQADFVVLCSDAKERHTVTAAIQARFRLPLWHFGTL